MAREFSSRDFLLIGLLGFGVGIFASQCQGSAHGGSPGIGDSADRMARALERIADSMERSEKAVK